MTSLPRTASARFFMSSGTSASSLDAGYGKPCRPSVVTSLPHAWGASGPGLRFQCGVGGLARLEERVGGVGGLGVGVGGADCAQPVPGGAGGVVVAGGAAPRGPGGGVCV